MLFRLALLTLFFASPVLAKDPRCEGDPKARLARFSAAALKGQTDAQRLDVYVKACALDEVVTLASQLMAFETVSEEGAPPPAVISQMGKFLESWAKARGFGFHAQPDNAVFEVVWGDGPRRLGFVAHGDVVPAPPAEWSRSPFKAVVEGGRLYGRGSEDDKGPLATALVVLAFARELGLSPRGPVVVIVGNGEESGWAGMRAYLKKVPPPRFAVSLDGDFPVVVAHAGYVDWHLAAPLGSVEPRPGQLVATDVAAGEFITQVPSLASLTLSGSKNLEKKVRAALSSLEKTRPGLSAELKAVNGKWTLVAHGKAVHSSVPEGGHNALWDLAALAEKLPLAPNGISAMLQVVARRFDADFNGVKLGLAYEDRLMGKLVVSPDLLSVKDGMVRLGVNMRRPSGMSSEAFSAKLNQALAAIAKETGGQIKEGEEASVGEPSVADLAGPLVSTLLDIYRTHEAQPDAAGLVVRGSTYARLFPGGVDFGPGFPKQPIAGHMHDEFISLKNLQSIAEMTGQALYRLAIGPDPQGAR